MIDITDHSLYAPDKKERFSICDSYSLEFALLPANYPEQPLLFSDESDTLGAEWNYDVRPLSLEYFPFALVRFLDTANSPAEKTPSHEFFCSFVFPCSHDSF